MKKILISILIAALFTPYYPIQAGSNTDILAIPAGQRGFNAYNSLTRDNFVLFHDQGIKVVRIMFMDGDLLRPNREYNPNNFSHRQILPANLARFDQLIRWGREFNIKIIIDIHETPGLKRWFLEAGENEDWRLWQKSIIGEHYRATLIGLWKQLAAHLANQPEDAVAFELLNEPVPRLDPQNWADETHGYVWDNLQDRLIREIRKRDRNHLIIAAPAYSWRPNSLSEWIPSKEVLRDENLIVAVHAFFPINYTYQWDAWSGQVEYKIYPGEFTEQYYGASWWNLEKLQAVLLPIAEFQAKYGKLVCVSEFGVTRGAPGARTWLEDMITAMSGTSGIWGWSAHVWGEAEYAISKGIPYDAALGGMYDFAANADQLSAIISGINQP